MNRRKKYKKSSADDLYVNLDDTYAARGGIDHILLFITLCLVAIGVVMVYSSSNMLSYRLHNENAYHYLVVQLAACLLGLVGMIAISYIPYQLYDRFAKLILLFSIVGLVLVFTPLGHSVHSSSGKEFQRWLQIRGVQFQPVEVTKLALVIYVCQLLTRKQHQIHRLSRGVLPSTFILMIVFVLLYLQPDFGSALLLSAVVLVLLFVGGARPSQIILLVGIAGCLLYFSIKDDAYKMQRLTDFVESLKSPSGTNYQVTRSLGALALGGAFGTGIGNSIYKLSDLPYPHTDFIFAVLGEELGFAGTVTLTALFMLLIWRGVHIALNVRNGFAVLLAVGITTAIGLQAFVNIGVVIGILPTKGITLPFISYGGSSLLMSLLSVGILLNISREMNVK